MSLVLSGRGQALKRLLEREAGSMGNVTLHNYTTVQMGNRNQLVNSFPLATAIVNC